jgi:hypothetical protein
MPPKKEKKEKKDKVVKDEWKGGLSRKLAKNPPKFMNRGYLTKAQMKSFINDATDYPELFRDYLEDTLLDWTDAEKAEWTQAKMMKTISNIAKDFMEDEDMDEEREEYEGKGGRSRETSSKRFPVSADSFKKIGGKKSVKIIGAKQLATRGQRNELVEGLGASYNYFENAVATHMNLGYDTNLVVKLGDQREMSQQTHIEDATDAPYPIFDNRWAEEAEELEEGYVVNAPKKQGDPLWFQTHSGKEWNTPEGIGEGYWSRNLGIREPEEVAPIRDKYTGGEFRDYPREGKAKYTSHNFNKVITKTTGALQGGDDEYWEHYEEGKKTPANYSVLKGGSMPIKYTKGGEAWVGGVGYGDLYETNYDSSYIPTTGNHMWGGQNPKKQEKVHMKQAVFEGINYKSYRVPIKVEIRNKAWEKGSTAEQIAPPTHKYRGFPGKEVDIRSIEDLQELNLTQLKHIAKVQGIPVEDIEMNTGGVAGGGNKRLFTTGVKAQGRYKGLPHKYSRSMEVWEADKNGKWVMKKKIIKSGQMDTYTKEGGQRRKYRTTALDKEEIIDMIMKGGQKPLKKYVVPKGWVEEAVEENLEDESAEYGGALGETALASETYEVGKEEREAIIKEHATEADAPIDPNAPMVIPEEDLLDIQGDDSDEEFDAIDDSEVISDVLLDNHEPNKIIAHETELDHLIGATGMIKEAIDTRDFNIRHNQVIEQQTYKKSARGAQGERKTPRALESSLANIVFEDRPNYDKPLLEDTRTNYRIRKPLIVGKKSAVNPSVWSQQMIDGHYILEDSYSGFHIPERISGTQIERWKDKSYIGGGNIKNTRDFKKELKKRVKPIDTGSISTLHTLASFPRYDWKEAGDKQAPFKGTKYNMSVEGIQKTKEYSDYMSAFVVEATRETPFKGTRWHGKPTHHYSQGRTRTTDYSDYLSAKTLLKRPEHIFYDKESIGTHLEREQKMKWIKGEGHHFPHSDDIHNWATSSLWELAEDKKYITNSAGEQERYGVGLPLGSPIHPYSVMAKDPFIHNDDDMEGID